MKGAKETFILGTTDEANELNHLNKYGFACGFVKGKKVLDAGCGSGYGTQMMLDAGAKEVIGIDKRQDVIEYARQHYKGEFRQMDVMDMLFDDNCFDAVVSLDTIEHIEDYIKFIEEIKRTVKPGGIVIISTTNFAGNSMEKRRLKGWKYHKCVFTKEQFIKMFNDNFADTSFYVQDKTFTSFPGRGILDRILGVKRDCRVLKLEQIDYEPRTIIGVGKCGQKS